MNKIDRKLPVKKTQQDGFTILEALVAMTLMGVVMAMMMGHILMVHEGYHNDVVRTQINSNLRSALDLVAMNIRQAGENLQSSFPALVLENGGGDNPDVLKLRRNRMTEVLALCEDISSGTGVLPVSRSDNSVSQCVSVNVESSFNAYEQQRADDGNTSRVFIYDKATKLGEFLNYNSGQLTSGVYYLMTSGTSNDYNALTTAIYILEEFEFALDVEEEILTLTVDGEADSTMSVAFDVTGFEVTLQMKDGSEQTELLANDPDFDWKDLHYVDVRLDGEKERKSNVFESSVTARYFPRNVLSYDG